MHARIIKQREEGDADDIMQPHLMAASSRMSLWCKSDAEMNVLAARTAASTTLGSSLGAS